MELPEEPSRIPPFNMEAEQRFLGALLANNKVHDRALFLEPEHFSDPVHARIFLEARELIEQRRIADSVTLTTILQNTKALDPAGGTGYLSGLLAAMVGTINAADYAKIIRDTWMCRELIDVGETLVNEAFGGKEPANPVEIAARAIALIDSVIAGTAAQDNMVSLGAAMQGAMLKLDEAMRTGRVSGLSTGFGNLDTRLGGLDPKFVYTIAGRPGMGKSALGLQIAINAARQGVGVLAWSLEMSAEQLAQRTLSAAARVPLQAIKTGRTSQAEYERLFLAQKELASLPLTIDDTAGQTPRMLAAKARSVKRKQGLGLVVLDHLNLTRPDGDDAKHGPTFAIERASGATLQIAKDNGLPAIMLVQLNRGVEGREDKRPNLSDLRQSGAIEQDSHAVGFVYREEYYLRNHPPEQKDGETADSINRRMILHQERLDSIAGQADVIWQKNRDGDPGTDRIYFDGRTTSFSEERRYD